MSQNNRASESQVAATHSRVTRVINKVLEIYEERLEAYSESEAELFVEPSPAFLTVATRFLKDNQITCAPEDNEEVSELQKRLNEKRGKKRLASVSPLQKANSE